MVEALLIAAITLGIGLFSLICITEHLLDTLKWPYIKIINRIGPFWIVWVAAFIYFLSY